MCMWASSTGVLQPSAQAINFTLTFICTDTFHTFIVFNRALHCLSQYQFVSEMSVLVSNIWLTGYCHRHRINSARSTSACACVCAMCGKSSRQRVVPVSIQFDGKCLECNFVLPVETVKLFLTSNVLALPFAY